MYLCMDESHNVWTKNRKEKKVTNRACGRVALYKKSDLKVFHLSPPNIEAIFSASKRPIISDEVSTSSSWCPLQLLCNDNISK